MSVAKSCGKSARDGKVFVTSAQIKNSFEISNNGRWKMPSLKSSRLVKRNMNTRSRNLCTLIFNLVNRFNVPYNRKRVDKLTYKLESILYSLYSVSIITN